MVRDVRGLDGNPFNFESIKIETSELLKDYCDRVKIILAPNIKDVCFARKVGYNIQEIELDEKIQKISATKIRAEARKQGKLSYKI